MLVDEERGPSIMDRLRDLKENINIPAEFKTALQAMMR